jgi:hypothetical protein
MEWPLRLGYSPFINHILIDEALTAYNEIVPMGVSTLPATARRT